MSEISKRRRVSEEIGTEATESLAAPVRGERLRALRARWRARVTHYESLVDLEPEYAARVARLEAIGNGNCRLNSNDFRALVQRVFGNPQEEYLTIHVTGTNGKGTVSHVTAKMLHEYGLGPVGLYTSPHIETVRERFCIGTSMISTAELLAVLDVIDEQLHDQRLIFFQVCCLIGFLWFYFRKVFVAVVEVGIGGRKDSTCVISDPLCAVVTNVNYDHTAMLGNTLQQIAADKMSIFKHRCYSIVGPLTLHRGHPHFTECKTCSDMYSIAIESVKKNTVSRICRLILLGDEPPTLRPLLQREGATQVKMTNGRADGLAMHGAELTCEVDRYEPCQNYGIDEAGYVNAIIARACAQFVVARIRGPSRVLEVPLENHRPRGRLQYDGETHVLLDCAHNDGALVNLATYLRRRGIPWVTLAVALSRKRSMKVFNGLIDQLGEAKIEKVVYLNYQHPLARSEADLRADLAQGAENRLVKWLAATWDPSTPLETQVWDLLQFPRRGILVFCGTFYALADVQRCLAGARAAKIF